MHAQQQYFNHSEAGDLSGLFAGRFDTDIGSKLDADSYTRIAQAQRRAPQALLFLSDHAGELAAARRAGLQVVQVLRELRQAGAGFTAIHSFEDIRVEPLPSALWCVWRRARGTSASIAAADTLMAGGRDTGIRPWVPMAGAARQAASLAAIRAVRAAG